MAIDDSVSPGLGLADEGAPPASSAASMKRPRKDKLKIDKAAIAQRVVDFYVQDDQDRAFDIAARLQRYAKFRMWTEGKDWPWPDSSDAAIPDMQTHSLRVQDTLHNAVMSTRPSIVAKALNKANSEKEERVANVLDFQFFNENKGESLVSSAASAFVNDGLMTFFIPWVKDEREVHELHTIPGLPAGATPEAHCSKFLQSTYPGQLFKQKDDHGWSWEVTKDGEKWFDVEFYTVGDEIEMDAQRTVEIFNGPCPMVKDYEDILAPVRAANLNIPTPSNPGGAAHVIVVDYPTIDEITRLKASGFYDLIDDDDVQRLEGARKDTTIGQSIKQQTDAFQGVVENESANTEAAEGKTPGHKTLTRLTCFDLFDIDGDGIAEDVIFTVIKEEMLLLRVRELTQVYPANPPRRPFAEAAFIPVAGRRAGISLLEQMEGLHDMIKQFADQTIDGGTLKNVPFFFYRATSNMRPETIRMAPGEGYPLSDPKNDVHWPIIPDNGTAFGMNLMTMFGQMEEKITNIGDLQLGRVPQGKASALRTVRGMQGVMAQGDARPEHILRRFFTCLAEVYHQMHELNQVFLPKEKVVRVFGIAKRNDDPFVTINDANAIRGRFMFDFTANAMNTSKEALQGSLDELMGMYLTPIALQLGVIDAEGAYQLLRDAGKARGQNPDRYLKPPSADAQLPRMFAEEVISLIMAGNLPECRPAETNAMDHMGKLMEFAGRDEFGYLSQEGVQLYKGYLGLLRQRMQAEASQQALMAASKQFQGGGPPGVPGPEGSAPIDMAQAPVQRNELLDESLPGAGGGGNPGMLQ